MNFPKMLLPFNGKTMIETVIGNIMQSDIHRIMLVTGAYRNKIENVSKKVKIDFCHNENYKDGMLSSVQCGVRAIPDGAGAFLVFPGDKPFITAEVINLLIHSFKKAKKGIVIPLFMKKRGHPVLIDMKYRDEIAKLDPEKGLRSLAALFPGDVLEVETTQPGILKDIDTYEDYERSINQTQ